MKHVLITGATRNTGFCIARRFAECGYCVHITGRNVNDVQKVAQEIIKEFPNSNAFGYKADISKTEDIKEMFSSIRKNTNSLDVFVANAANLGIGFDVYNTDFKDFDEIINTNIRGTFFCAKECGKLMTEKGGSIILLSSVQSKGAVEGRSVYGITKAAINYMAKALAYDFAPYGIRVNTLLAGAIHTDRWDISEDEKLSAMRANYPLGRESTMDEIANGVMYLAGDSSKTVTGTELLIDSGVSVSLLPYSARREFKRDDF